MSPLLPVPNSSAIKLLFRMNVDLGKSSGRRVRAVVAHGKAVLFKTRLVPQREELLGSKTQTYMFTISPSTPRLVFEHLF